MAYAKTEGKELTEEQLAAVAGGLYSSKNCFCAVGGGGKDPDTGNNCACVATGFGKEDKALRGLVCVLAGAIAQMYE